MAKDKNNKNDQNIDINDLEWNDYVLSLLSDEEKIDGNPTTDGLRRIFEIALKCTIIDAYSDVIQTPNIDNEKRATVTHKLTYILNDPTLGTEFKKRTVSGSADVYYGNCEKIYRNHPVAVAETRAEGRALRRGLRLRKVVAAEEISSSIDDNPDADSVGKITEQQINFIDVLSKRNNINISELLIEHGVNPIEIGAVSHDKGVEIIRSLSKLQQNNDQITEKLTGYKEGWRL